MELIKIADRYGLDGLKDLCSRYIIKEFTVDNIIEIANMAEENNLDILKKAAISFILQFRQDISEYYDLCALSKSIIIQMFMQEA